MSRRTPPASNRSRRSPCPVACTLDILGDKWTLLIVRDMLLGRARFTDFTESPEGIPTNILTDRLRRLVDTGVAERVDTDTARKAYRLTEKGVALKDVLVAMRNWGLAWEPGTREGMTRR